MGYLTYQSLSLEGLYELLTESTREFLVALEAKQKDDLAINAKKKQIEMLLSIIQDKKKHKTETKKS